jgi:serine/threonine-protein kinase
VSVDKHAEATGWLERMYNEGSGLLVYLKVEPHFDPLRGEPRFQALMRKVGLAG